MTPADRTLSRLRERLLARMATRLAHDFNNELTVIGGQADLARSAPNQRIDERLERIRTVARSAHARNRLVLELASAEPGHPDLLNAHDVEDDIRLLAALVLGRDADCTVSVAPEVTAALPRDPLRLLIGGLLLAGLNRARADERPVLAIAVSAAGSTVRLHFEAHNAAPAPRWLEAVASVCMVAPESAALASGWSMGIDLEPLQPDPQAAASGATPDSGAAGRRILVVDDDDDVRNVFVQALRLEHYEVLEAATAAEAVDLAATLDGLHLLITDARLDAAMDGPALAAELRERWPQMPVVIASGEPAAHDRELPGNSQWLRKPVPLRDLQRQVAELLAH